jgi:hypothetical protein
MRSKRRLSGGLERLPGGNRGARGALYRRIGADIARQLGIEPTSPLILSVSLAARLYMTALAVSDRLEEALQARQQGRGRRPSASAIDRLEHRQLVAANAYQNALAALREQAPRRNTALEQALERGRLDREERARQAAAKRAAELS